MPGLDVEGANRASQRSSSSYSGALRALTRAWHLIAFVPCTRVLVRRPSLAEKLSNGTQNSRHGLASNRRMSCAVNSLGLGTGTDE